MTNIFLSTTIPCDTIQYLQNINDNIDAVRHIVDVSNSTIANASTSSVASSRRKVSKIKDNSEKKENKIIA